MIYGLIICAGKQTRYACSVPKSLAMLDDTTTILDINIKNMSKYSDVVYIVCSNENSKYFSNYNNLIVIESGYGSGDAILKVFNKLDIKDGDTCFIQWGDSLQKDTSVFNKLLNNYNGISLIPCTFEDKPYVQVIQIDNKVKVLFSKFNEQVSSGYHDLSIFYCNANDLLKYLNEWRDNNFIDGHYCHKHSNEFEFLDVFNDTDIRATVLNIENYNDFSFNTVEQFNKLKESLNV